MHEDLRGAVATWQMQMKGEPLHTMEQDCNLVAVVGIKHLSKLSCQLDP